MRKRVNHIRKILCQHLGASRSPYNIAEEGKMVDIDGEKNDRRIKGKEVLLKDGDEATSLENMEDIYASVWTWGIE